jgi:uncharacterized protein YecE (DUF72 family)
MELRIGTSGWHYPGGRGTWDGIFYPAPGDRQPGFDELRFYAERFNTVEVNSTFYGQPRPNVSLGWVRRTPPGFEFSVKLFQKFTHPATAQDTTPVSAADVDAFRAGIEPLAAGGRLGSVLAQFPSRFHDTTEARAYLHWLLRTFGDYPLAVELRHRSWSDAATDTTALLAEAGAAWVQIDEPKFASSVHQALEPNAGVMYVRLHGRNAAQWWTHEESEDRYNYLYSGPELQPIVDKLRAARAQVRKLYLYMNNHFAAQAVANATMVRQLMDEPVTARMPSELVSAYPMLEGLVATLPPARLL